MRDTAVDSGVFPLAGIQVRVLERENALNADGNPEHAYLDTAVRLRGGRDDERIYLRAMEGRGAGRYGIFNAFFLYIHDPDQHSPPSFQVTSLLAERLPVQVPVESGM